MYNEGVYNDCTDKTYAGVCDVRCVTYVPDNVRYGSWIHALRLFTVEMCLFT